jgi:hypothetical protein
MCYRLDRAPGRAVRVADRPDVAPCARSPDGEQDGWGTDGTDAEMPGFVAVSRCDMPEWLSPDVRRCRGGDSPQ